MIAGLGGSQGLGISTFITSRQIISTDASFAATTRDITITSVNTSNVIMVPQRSDGAANADPSRDSTSFSLTSSTNLRLTKGTASTGSGEPIIVQIFEINPSAFTLNQFISKTETPQSSAYMDITITAVDTAKTFVIPHGVSTAKNTGHCELGSINLTTTTNARFYMSQTQSTNTTVKGQVITLI